jgi:hypothetical protein
MGTDPAPMSLLEVGGIFIFLFVIIMLEGVVGVWRARRKARFHG